MNASLNFFYVLSEEVAGKYVFKKTRFFSGVADSDCNQK